MSKSFSRCSTLVTIIFIALLSVIYFMVHLDRALARPFTTFTVNNTNDSGIGSLRQAILDANANVGDDLIEIRPLNGGFDMGYDELNLVDFLLNKLYLPLATR
ncbi:hypothetical protein MNBD_CHLOROFLEXI01-2114 [hydrothermal vent metagenome]|uniref:Uncharacterized protein n=1 Tax=hydrothermal vent metagenome TaxID=652676 RepID=A0A3B0UM41_9ZZZZ